MGASHEKMVQMDINGIVSIVEPWRQRKSAGLFLDSWRPGRTAPVGCCFPRSADDNRGKPVRPIGRRDRIELDGVTDHAATRVPILGSVLDGGTTSTPAVWQPALRGEPPRVSVRGPEFGVEVEKNVGIVMRDGVRLAADIYRPASDGKAVGRRFPTLLTRTPYNKDGTSGDGRYYAERGYVVVANDVRGRYASDGKWRLIDDDPEDGYEVVEWIAGRIGPTARLERSARVIPEARSTLSPR